MVKPASRIRFVPFLLAFGGCNVLAGNDEPTLVSADAGTTDAPPALDSSGPDASGTADASDASSTVDARSDASTLCNAAPCGAT